MTGRNFCNWPNVNRLFHSLCTLPALMVGNLPPTIRAVHRECERVYCDGHMTDGNLCQMSIDSFTVSVDSPNGRQFVCERVYCDGRVVMESMLEMWLVIKLWVMTGSMTGMIEVWNSLDYVIKSWRYLNVMTEMWRNYDEELWQCCDEMWQWGWVVKVMMRCDKVEMEMWLKLRWWCDKIRDVTESRDGNVT